jgi:hypothetical protein
MGSNHWLADVPGQGASLEILYPGKDMARDPYQLYTMRADPAIACDDSLQQAPIQQISYTTASGTAGVGDFTMGDGFEVFSDPAGNVSWRMGTGDTVRLGFKLPDGLPPNIQRMYVHASNTQILVLSVSGEAVSESRAMVLRKSDSTWRVLPQPLSDGCLRVFGKYVAVTESHIKKAIVAQLKAHPGMISIDTEVMEQERSAGLGTGGSFANSVLVYPGRLHIFDSGTGNVFTITTNQGDSEILLIDNYIVYYRVSDRLYRASISSNTLGQGRLLAKDEAIRDAHWAFANQSKH